MSESEALQIAVLSTKLDNITRLNELQDERIKGMVTELQHLSTSVDLRARQFESALATSESARARVEGGIEVRFTKIEGVIEKQVVERATQIAAVKAEAKNATARVTAELETHLLQHSRDRGWVQYAVNAVIAAATAIGSVALVFVTLHP